MQKRFAACLAILLMVLTWAAGGNISSVKAAESVTNDTAMRTEQYTVDVTVNKDQSYTITEKIKVSFLQDRHGIYRYIPNKGKMFYAENGKTKQMPYYAKVKMKDSNVDYEKDSDDGNVVFRFGDEDTYVRKGNYQFTYDFIPQYQEASLNQAYYNIFPLQWQNQIPKGSKFTIHFQQGTDMENIRFYTGEYGSKEDASDLFDLKMDKENHTIEGTLKKNMALGTGLTFYKPMESGYFTSGHQPKGNWIVLGITAIVFIVTAALYLLFGRDEKIITSVQYQPPEGLDSAAVGYVIDGTLDDKDVVSLILYWADKGYLRIEEKKKKDVLLVKLKDLEEDAPNYQKEMFKKLFKKKDSVKTSSLKYKFADTIAVVKDQIQIGYKHKIYTKESAAARILSIFIIPIPLISFIIMIGIYTYLSAGTIFLLIAGVILFLIGEIWAVGSVDFWYKTGKKMKKINMMVSVLFPLAGAAVCWIGYRNQVVQANVFDFLWVYYIVAAVSLITLLFTAFMKKRTRQCIDWMGRLAGLRDFIETAELDRMKVMAEEHPEMFYHILPYASVLGVSDIFSKKLDAIALPAPDWYVAYPGDTLFHFYWIHRCMNRVASDSLLAVKAPSSTGSGGGSSFSGGGFSGGGFGGGGGGSW